MRGAQRPQIVAFAHATCAAFMATVLTLLGQEVGADIATETDAIRVRPQASAGK